LRKKLCKLLGRDDFPTATLADSNEVKIGDWCFAIGNPFLLATDFQPTVSFGIVGSQLQVVLSNTSIGDVLVPSDVLTAVFFARVARTGVWIGLLSSTSPRPFLPCTRWNRA